jgi:hypothetical protein
MEVESDRCGCNGEALCAEKSSRESVDHSVKLAPAFSGDIGGEAMNAGPGNAGSRSSVEFYEVPVHTL